MTTYLDRDLADGVRNLAAAITTLEQPLPLDRLDLTSAVDLVTEAALSLKPYIPGYDPATGLLEGEADDEDIPVPSEPAWAGALLDVVWEAQLLRHRPTALSLAHRVVKLSDFTGQLVTWHPDYDNETGGLAPA